MNILVRKPLHLLLKEAEETGEHSLKRTLGVFQLTALGVGAIIGAGIFVLSGLGAHYAGPGLMLSFVISGLGCAFAGLCYAEFAAMIPLAGCANDSAALAAAAASAAGPSVAGAAAGKVFADVDAIARSHGGRPETLAGLAGAGDLVATVVAPSSRNKRAGELLSQGVPSTEIGMVLGQVAEAVDCVPLLANVARGARLDTP